MDLGEAGVGEQRPLRWARQIALVFDFSAGESETLLYPRCRAEPRACTSSSMASRWRANAAGDPIHRDQLEHIPAVTANAAQLHLAHQGR